MHISLRKYETEGAAGVPEKHSGGSSSSTGASGASRR